MAKGNRFSSLPVSQFCPRSAALNLGAGRAAAVSSCFHARCAGDDKWREMYARLSDDEQLELDEMKAPKAVRIHDIELSYDNMEKELAVGLTSECGYVPKGHPDALCEGTLDMVAIVRTTAYVVDIKRSEYTTAEGPDSLQVKGYALAICAKHPEVTHYVTGIYAAQEGTWTFAAPIAVDSEQCLKDWQRVKAAASNLEGDYATGPHCRGCYARFNCPAWLVPPEHASDGIAEFFCGELDTAKVLKLKLMRDRVKDTMEKADAIIKAHVEVYGPLKDPETGKAFRSVQCQGRVSLDKAALEHDHPELVKSYMRQGKPYTMTRWTNGASK